MSTKTYPRRNDWQRPLEIFLNRYKTSMDTFFCAEESRQAGEDPIGTGENYQVYVLVECPTPWTRNAFDSKPIPQNLRALREEVSQTGLSVRLLLIYNEHLKQTNSTRCIIFRQQEAFSKGYNKQEFQVPNISNVTPILKECLLNEILHESTETQTRDILICTHGSNDKCCAKYGIPFYKHALSTVAKLSLNHVRIWQVSHFGGHRFAPTVIDFPEGRYYARLDQVSLTSILTRTGDVQCFNNIYRGWGTLPHPAQVLERELILMHGWDWFNYKVACRVLEQSEDGRFNRVELSFKKPDGSLSCTQADVVEDERKNLYLMGECHGMEAEKTPQFFVKNLVNVERVASRI
ncbi:sucrase ferredoxin [Mastigocladopsis repens]|uniref:sucrase ferredoxin n=1 Tax=Mastigocladopsis repens TaxID=221287 RepID=UPI001E32E930|nr:sucrase ferredoxin [Mastigocladopsis repens]